MSKRRPEEKKTKLVKKRGGKVTKKGVTPKVVPTTKGVNNQVKEVVIENRAKKLYSLPPGFVYGPIVTGEKLEISTTPCRMKLGLPTPEGKTVWKVNKELFTVVKMVNNVQILERYKPISLAKTSAATIKFLRAARKITTSIVARAQSAIDAIDLGINTLRLGEALDNEQKAQLLLAARNDLAQIVAQNRRESILGKYDEMREEIIKKEPSFMSDALAESIHKLSTKETIVIDDME